ncbi:MAG: hypothetical protein M5T61_21410 [Acidimicrobiia bacterium]|nr:hypothetical protein [Acidimicrobiia bacterium]
MDHHGQPGRLALVEVDGTRRRHERPGEPVVHVELVVDRGLAAEQDAERVDLVAAEEREQRRARYARACRGVAVTVALFMASAYMSGLRSTRLRVASNVSPVRNRLTLIVEPAGVRVGDFLVVGDVDAGVVVVAAPLVPELRPPTGNEASESSSSGSWSMEGPTFGECGRSPQEGPAGVSRRPIPMGGGLHTTPAPCSSPSAISAPWFTLRGGTASPS